MKAKTIRFLLTDKSDFGKSLKRAYHSHTDAMARGEYSPPITGPNKGRTGYVDKGLAMKWALNNALTRNKK